MPKRIPFTAPIKIYYFKDEAMVSCSFMITESVVLKTEFTEKEFDYICENWNVDDGVQGLRTEHNGKIWWERRTIGPRPTCVDCDHVVIDVRDFNFRIDTDVMENVVKEYSFQKANQVYWSVDED